MSAFRPKASGVDSRNIRQAYTERKVACMVANGTSEEDARYILEQARQVRANKREQRRLTGAWIRENG